MAESLAAGYQDQLLFLGRGFGDVVPYIVMIAVLMVRPSGLFGTKELTRVWSTTVATTEALPQAQNRTWPRPS